MAICTFPSDVDNGVDGSESSESEDDDESSGSKYGKPSQWQA